METRSLDAAQAFTTKDGSTIRELFGLPTGGTVLQSLAESRLPRRAAARSATTTRSPRRSTSSSRAGPTWSSTARTPELGPGDAVAIPPGCLARDHGARRRRAALPLLLRTAYRHEDTHFE